MKTIKYLVDFRARRAGDVRREEDGVAAEVIRRGFAEETDAEPDEAGGDGSAVAQYRPDGQEDGGSRSPGETGLPTESAALDAPGSVGINAAEGEQAEGARPADD